MLCGGERPAGLPAELEKGYYFAPTVIGDVTPGMTIVQEEVFGPVVVVYTFKDEVRIARTRPSFCGVAACVVGMCGPTTAHEPHTRAPALASRRRDRTRPSSLPTTRPSASRQRCGRRTWHEHTAWRTSWTWVWCGSTTTTAMTRAAHGVA